jgi:hypothetical protein
VSPSSPDSLQDAEKVRQAAFSHRSEAQRTEAYASPLRSLRPCWTAFLSILKLFWLSTIPTIPAILSVLTEFYVTCYGFSTGFSATGSALGARSVATYMVTAFASASFSPNAGMRVCASIACGFFSQR